jgi:hypothetical protein
MGFVSVFFHKWGFPQRDLGDTACMWGTKRKDFMAYDEKAVSLHVCGVDKHPAIPLG